MTAPMSYGEASLARRRGRAGLKCVNTKSEDNLLLYPVCEGLVADGCRSSDCFILK